MEDVLDKFRERYAGRTVLVTGGAGAIGSNLVRGLLEAEVKTVYVIDNFSSSEMWNIPSTSEVLVVEGSILDEEKLKRVFFDRPEIVFHLAAFFANQNSVDNPEKDLTTNGLGTLRLLQYSFLTGVQRFVYASSGGAIYSSNTPLPLREEYMSMNLGSPYQITKMLGELYCNFFHSHYGLPAVKTRFFNSYGPGEVPGQYRNVIPNFIYWALRGLALPITGSGEETRDFTFVGDIVDGLLRCGVMESAVGQEFNLASGHETRIIELANMVNTAVGSSAGISFVERRKWDTKSRRWASIERARTLLGYEPSTCLEDGVKKTVVWFRANWDRITEAARFSPGASAAVREMIGR